MHITGIIGALEIISPALDLLLDYTQSISRQGYLQQALELVFYWASQELGH